MILPEDTSIELSEVWILGMYKEHTLMILSP